MLATQPKGKLDRTEGSIFRNIVKLSFPMMLGNLFQSLFNVVDMIWISRLGTEYIAAVSMAGMIMMLIMSVIIGFAHATNAMVSRLWGQKRYDEAAKATYNSLAVSLFASIIISILGILLSRPILSLLGADAVVVDLSYDYLFISFAGFFSLFLFFIINSSMQGSGNSITPMKLLFFAVAINIGLDPILIFGYFGFAALGVEGAAYATVISRVIMLFIGLFILFNGKTHLQISKKVMILSKSYIINFIKIGTPSSLQLSFRTIAGVIILKFVAVFGTTAIAAYGVGLRIQYFVLIPVFGLASATAALVGQNLGANKPKRSIKTVWYSIILYEIILLPFIFVAVFYPEILMYPFSLEGDVSEILKVFIYFLTGILSTASFGIIINRGMIGAGYTFVPMLITFTSQILFEIPLIFYFIYYTKLGINTIFLSLILTNIFQICITLYVFNQKKWLEKKIV